MEDIDRVSYLEALVTSILAIKCQFLMQARTFEIPLSRLPIITVYHWLVVVGCVGMQTVVINAINEAWKIAERER